MKTTIFKRYLVTILAIMMLGATAVAQPKSGNDSSRRKQWMKEMREFKHSFLAKELELTDEQRDSFFAVYDEMEDKLMRIGHEVRQMERSISKKGDEATDLEYEKAAEAMYESKVKEGAVETEYLPRLKKVLTPKQLFRLKSAEFKFTKTLMDKRPPKPQHKK